MGRPVGKIVGGFRHKKMVPQKKMMRVIVNRGLGHVTQMVPQLQRIAGSAARQFHETQLDFEYKRVYRA